MCGGGPPSDAVQAEALRAALEAFADSRRKSLCYRRGDAAQTSRAVDVLLLQRQWRTM